MKTLSLFSKNSRNADVLESLRNGQSRKDRIELLDRGNGNNLDSLPNFTICQACTRLRARSVPSTRSGRESRPVNLTGRIGPEMRFLHPAALWREPAWCLAGFRAQQSTIVDCRSTIVDWKSRLKKPKPSTRWASLFSLAFAMTVTSKAGACASGRSPPLVVDRSTPRWQASTHRT